MKFSMEESNQDGHIAESENFIDVLEEYSALQKEVERIMRLAKERIPHLDAERLHYLKEAIGDIEDLIAAPEEKGWTAEKWKEDK